MRHRDSIRVRSDLSYLAILILLSLAVGICFILTTVLIAADGVSYIESARRIFDRPAAEIRSDRGFGYPFLIFLAHKALNPRGSNDSILHWIYAAQGVTLLCRTLSLIPLYYIGKMLVGRRRSFWGLVVLVLLPYPAEFGSDVLRDWPHLLFLTSAMAFLMVASRTNRGGLFAAAGLTAGFGYMIRPECAQVIVYGWLWLLVSLWIPRPNTGRLKSIGFIGILLIGFMIPWLPYMKIREGALPAKLRVLISAHLSEPAWESGYCVSEDGTAVSAGFRFPGELMKAFGKLARQTSENLSYVFVLPWIAGLSCRFRKIRNLWPAETFFIAALIALYGLMMVLLYTRYHYISKRHCMPLVVFTAFYIPVGLQWMAYGLSRKHVSGRITRARIRRRWFLILLGIGITVSIGKIARLVPLRADKQGYRQAAAWLKIHTRPDDLIACPFPIPRVGFYAERSIARTQLRTSMISAGRLTEGNWYHLAGTFDGLDQKLYINGQCAADKRTDLRGLGAGHNTFSIGKPSAKSNLVYEGRIGTVRLYGKALSPEDMDRIFHGRNVSDQAERYQIGAWSLSSGGFQTNGRQAVPEEMAIDWGENWINLSGRMAGQAIDELTISVTIKPVFLERMNWITGNGGQFCLGLRNGKAFFWICEPQPGSMVPEEADYVVIAVREPARQIDKIFNKSLEKVYSVWANPKNKKEEILIYRVIP